MQWSWSLQQWSLSGYYNKTSWVVRTYLGNDFCSQHETWNMPTRNLHLRLLTWWSGLSDRCTCSSICHERTYLCNLVLWEQLQWTCWNVHHTNIQPCVAMEIPFPEFAVLSVFYWMVTLDPYTFQCTCGSNCNIWIAGTQVISNSQQFGLTPAPIIIFVLKLRTTEDMQAFNCDGIFVVVVIAQYFESTEYCWLITGGFTQYIYLFAIDIQSVLLWYRMPS